MPRRPYRSVRPRRGGEGKRRERFVHLAAKLLPITKVLSVALALALAVQVVVLIVPYGFLQHGDVFRAHGHSRFLQARTRLYSPAQTEPPTSTVTGNALEPAAAHVGIHFAGTRRPPPSTATPSSDSPAARAAAAPSPGDRVHGNLWTKEILDVLDHYFGPDFRFEQNCATRACPADLRASEVYCCDSPTVTLVVRSDLIRDNPWYKGDGPLSAAVDSLGQVVLRSRRPRFGTPQTCEVLNGPQPTPTADPRCAGGDDAPEVLGRSLPYFLIYKGVSHQAVCVSKDGRVLQLGVHGFLLGDELGKSCDRMSSLPAPANATDATAVVDTVVVLTQPWAQAPFHWTAESFLRVGAAWELIANNQSTLVHIPKQGRLASQLANLHSVGVKKQQVVSGNVCARQVVVPMVSHCGQTTSSLALFVRQLAWKAMQGGPAATASPWSIRPTAPRREKIVLARSERSAQVQNYDQLRDLLAGLATGAFDLVEFSDPPPVPADALALFYDAAVVVGVSGSALAHLYVSRPQTVVVEILPYQRINLCYRGMAVALGLAYHGFVPNGPPAHENITLDQSDLNYLQSIVVRRVGGATGAGPAAATVSDPDPRDGPAPAPFLPRLATLGDVTAPPDVGSPPLDLGSPPLPEASYTVSDFVRLGATDTWTADIVRLPASASDDALCGEATTFAVVVKSPFALAAGTAVAAAGGQPCRWTARVRMPPLAGAYEVVTTVEFVGHLALYQEWPSRQAWQESTHTGRLVHRPLLVGGTQTVTVSEDVAAALAGAAETSWCAATPARRLPGYWITPLHGPQLYQPFDCRLRRLPTAVDLDALVDVTAPGTAYLASLVAVQASEASTHELWGAIRQKWIAMYGDSNTRNLWIELCSRLGGSVESPLEKLHKPDGIEDAVCSHPQFLLTLGFWWTGMAPPLHERLNVSARELVQRARADPSKLDNGVLAKQAPDRLVINLGTHDTHATVSLPPVVRKSLERGAWLGPGGRVVLSTTYATDATKLWRVEALKDLELIQNNHRIARVNDALDAQMPGCRMLDLYALSEGPSLLSVYRDAAHPPRQVYEESAHVLLNYMSG